jgi:serine protease Do
LLPVGKEVPLRLIRDGKEMTLNVKVATLEAREAAQGKTADKAPDESKWGLQLQDLSPEAAAEAGLRPGQGVVIAGVRPGSPAEEASLRQGDIVLEIDRQPVKGVEEMKARMARTGGKGQALLLIQRGRNTLYLVLKG